MALRSRKVCARFIALCRRLDLLADACVAIDGAKFKAVNTRDKNFTRAKMQRRLEQIEESVERYLHQLDSADRQEPSLARTTKTARLKDKIATLKEEMQRLAKLEVRMLATPDQQISLTDPDARSMATSGRGSGMVGYNVQAAVDNQTSSDRRPRSHQRGHRPRPTLLHGQADEGCSGDRHAGCRCRSRATSTAQRSWPAMRPVLRSHFQSRSPQTTKPRAGLSNKIFAMWPEEDVYLCPAGERLVYHYTNVENGLTLHRYWTTACQGCAIKDQCTTGKERRITRWEHEDILEAVQRRLDEHPEKMRQRRETVEHPFGTIKSWMGSTHFQLKTLKRVGTEMALHVLAYNLKRVMNIMGIRPLIAAMSAA